MIPSQHAGGPGEAARARDGQEETDVVPLPIVYGHRCAFSHNRCAEKSSCRPPLAGLASRATSGGYHADDDSGKIRWVVAPPRARGAYPVLLGAMVAICTLALVARWPYRATYGLTVLGLVAVLMALEFLFPYRDEWRTTKRSLVRDLKYITAGSVTVGLVHALLGAVALALAERHTGPLAQ